MTEKRKMEKGSCSSKIGMEESFMKLLLPSNKEEEVKPHFFKIIICPSIQSRKLRLPPAFTQQNGDTLCGYAYLKAPKGKEHRVTLVKKDGNLWFKHGWSTFCQSYSLAHGHFLVFRYQGQSRFNVFIFGKSCLEIEYPEFDSSSDDDDDDEDRLDGDEDEEEKEDDEDFVVDDEDEDEEEEEEEEDDEEEEEEEEEIPHGNSVDGGSALRKAKAFQCDKPHFIVSMQQGCFQDYRMWIPRSHSVKYLKNGGNGTRVKLHVGGKSWEASLEEPRDGYLRISKQGWKTFSMDNHLNLNHVLLFELINADSLAYNLHIFRP